MIEDIVLGQVREIRFIGESIAALLEPLFMLDKEKQEWILIQDVQKQYPNRGRVTWIKAPEEIVVDSLWRFTYELHPTFDPTDLKRDRYRINWYRSPEEPLEVLYLPKREPDQVLELLETGLKLPFVPTTYVYIALSDETWPGPIKLVSDKTETVWMIDPQQRQTPIDRVIALSNNYLDTIKLGINRTFLKHDAPIPVKVGEFDWAPIQLVIKRLLRDAQKVTNIREHYALTKAIIDQYVESVTSTDLSLVAQQIRRVGKFFSAWQRLNIDITQFESELFEHPTIVKRIAAAEEEGRRSAKAHAERILLEQARRELEEIRTERQHLRDDINDLQIQFVQVQQEAETARQQASEQAEAEIQKRMLEIRALDEQITKRKIELEEQLNYASNEVSKRIAELVAKPSEALSQIGIIRAALGQQQILTQKNGYPTYLNPTERKNLHPPVSVLRQGESEISDQLLLGKFLRKVAQTVGAEVSTVRAIHTALLAGQIPLLSGTGAFDMLELYATIITGGRMLGVHVPPTLLEPADLLGRIEPHSGQFVPHNNGLIDLLLFASQPEQSERLFLVVLDGINRSAIDTYLYPLLASYQAARLHHKQRPLSIAHPSMFSANDPYAKVAQFHWPANVLMLGILSDGSASLPLPPSVWDYAFFVNLNALKIPEQASQQLPLSAVSASQWKRWATELEERNDKGQKILRQIVEFNEFKLPSKLSRHFIQIYATYLRWDSNEMGAIQLAVRGILLPYAHATRQLETLQDKLQHLGINIDLAEIAAMQQAVE